MCLEIQALVPEEPAGAAVSAKRQSVSALTMSRPLYGSGLRVKGRASLRGRDWRKSGIGMLSEDIKVGADAQTEKKKKKIISEGCVCLLVDV
jgi:hypothetical protein